jgi:hypothetical protein
VSILSLQNQHKPFFKNLCELTPYKIMLKIVFGNYTEGIQQVKKYLFKTIYRLPVRTARVYGIWATARFPTLLQLGVMVLQLGVMVLHPGGMEFHCGYTLHSHLT